MEEHVESLSQMLVQAERQLTLTKSALEESTAARDDLKATVRGEGAGARGHAKAVPPPPRGGGRQTPTASNGRKIKTRHKKKSP